MLDGVRRIVAAGGHPRGQKHTYGIQGPTGDVLHALTAKLREMAKGKGKRKALTLVQME